MDREAWWATVRADSKRGGHNLATKQQYTYICVHFFFTNAIVYFKHKT